MRKDLQYFLTTADTLYSKSACYSGLRHPVEVIALNDFIQLLDLKRF